MKAIQIQAMMTALLLSAAALVSCGAQQTDSNSESQSGADSPITDSTEIIKGDGIIEDSFGTIAGQSLPEATIPEKPDGVTPLKDDDGFKELQHKIHDANWKDAIFKNHSSLRCRHTALYHITHRIFPKRMCS